MSTENNTVELDMDDLDVFSSQLFGQNKEVVTEEPASSGNDQDVTDSESESDATKEDTHDDVDNQDDTTDESDEIDEHDSEEQDEEEDEEPEPHPKPKKNRAQERIEELNKKYREEQRARLDLEARLAKLEQNNQPDEVKPQKEFSGPTPDDKNEDGTDKYPLGEFDPNYISDHIKFALEQERKSIREQAEREAEQRLVDEQRAALQTEWQNKLVPAQERYPDFREKGEQLIETFSGIDEAYGEYLSATLMQMEFGPDVLYYLASNPDEAQKIVLSGPTKATIALGRLEAKFSEANEQKQKARPKVSKAPEPPVHTNKGSAVPVSEIPDDTDDLDLFEKKLFQKKRS